MDDACSSSRDVSANGNCRDSVGGGGFDEEEDGAEEEDDPSSSLSRPITNAGEAVVPLVANVRHHEEDQARGLYLQGVEAEYNGQLYDAIRFYRRALQLVPDIEFKMADLLPKSDKHDDDDDDNTSSGDEDETGVDNGVVDVQVHDTLNGKRLDLTARFFRILSKDGKLCHPFYEQRGCHVSILPSEILLYIFKWVVSTELDMTSLEQLSQVCRGFYLCARDTELWRLACIRVWGENCGPPIKYGSWREMFISKPRLRFNGAYISKTTYVRPGETAFQDQTYRPWHVVDYYRYVRFFADGLVFMLTSPDEPISSLPKLRQRNSRCTALLYGHYCIRDDLVTAILNRTKRSESMVPPSTSNHRYRRQRQIQLHDPGEQTFHLELEVTSYKTRNNYRLEWRRYSTRTVYRNGQESVTEFDLSLAKFPSLWFSRVKSYTAYSERPLGFR